MNDKIEDLDLEEYDGEQVVGGMEVGPVHPLLPEVGGIVGNLGKSVQPVNGSPARN